MAQTTSYRIESESDLRNFQDKVYIQTKRGKEGNLNPRFFGLLEVAMAEATIVTAIHNIKGNKGANTSGTDNETIRELIELRPEKLIPRIQEKFTNYQPKLIKRVYIPKPGKMEKRPLGIPTVEDRVIQECIRLSIEPILEAQFYEHSYGFRPMRETRQVLARLNYLMFTTGKIWIVEGDIKKCFDRMDHTIMLRQLYNMGICDKRILMIIKSMLKAGIMDELNVNPIGTPQGGIISPLLANVYLNSFDWHVANAYLHKQTTKTYSTDGNRMRAIDYSSNLAPAHLIRYADDWVLVTGSKEHAEIWKERLKWFLKDKLRLDLSEEKTKITNATEKAVKFLGFEIKMIPENGRGKMGLTTQSRPDQERLKTKVKEIREATFKLRKVKNKKLLFPEIMRVNSMIRGIINYYLPTTLVHIELKKYSRALQWGATRSLQKFGVDWVRANEVNNLLSVHSNYTAALPTVTIENMKIGITCLDFCKFQRPDTKNQEETPYTIKGRELYAKRTAKRPLLTRADELLGLPLAARIAYGQTPRKYNFEYFMNRAYAYNRDKGKCRICRTDIAGNDVHIHHMYPKVAMRYVNKVPNLATVCKQCHHRIHSNQDYPDMDRKAKAKLLAMREKLMITQI